MRHIHSHTSKALASGSGGWSLSNPVPKIRSLNWRCLFAMTARSRKRLATSLVQMLKRPYFSRVWVLQEMHLASQTSFCCGQDVRSFDSLLATSILVDYWVCLDHYWLHEGFRNMKSWWNISRYLNLRSLALSRDDARTYYETGIRRGCLALASGPRVARQLSEVLTVMRHFECADPRDRLYGVLSLVDWHESDGGHVPIPDYDQQPFSLAVGILQHYLSDAKFMPAGGSMFKWANELRSIFNLPEISHGLHLTMPMHYTGTQAPGKHPENVLRNDLDLRFMTNTILQTEPSLPAGSEIPKPSVFNQTWYGIRLLPAGQDNNVARSSYLPYVPSQQYYDPARIVHYDGEYLVTGFSNTQPHDIYMFSTTEYVTFRGGGGMSMILRPKEPGVCTIVNDGSQMGSLSKDLIRSLEWGHYQVQWTAETLLLFCCTMRMPYSTR
jgi:hypothetical protein